MRPAPPTRRRVRFTASRGRISSPFEETRRRIRRGAAPERETRPSTTSGRPERSTRRLRESSGAQCSCSPQDPFPRGRPPYSFQGNLRRPRLAPRHAVRDETSPPAPLHPSSRNACRTRRAPRMLSLIHISEPTRLGMISYAVFCLKKKKKLRSKTKQNETINENNIKVLHINNN